MLRSPAPPGRTLSACDTMWNGSNRGWLWLYPTERGWSRATMYIQICQDCETFRVDFAFEQQGADPLLLRTCGAVWSMQAEAAGLYVCMLESLEPMFPRQCRIQSKDCITRFRAASLRLAWCASMKGFKCKQSFSEKNMQVFRASVKIFYLCVIF